MASKEPIMSKKVCCTILRFLKNLINYICYKKDIELTLYRKTPNNLILCRHKRNNVMSRHCKPLADQGKVIKSLGKNIQNLKKIYKNLIKIKITAVH